MPVVLISFLDGEIVHAEIDDLSFDHLLLEGEVRGADPNNDRVLFPLSAIRQIVIGHPQKAPAGASAWDRAAFHFADGQVLRASIAPDGTLGRFGGVWRVVEPDAAEMCTLGIPYTALKGVYQLRHWDSRPVGSRGGAEFRGDRLARTLAERDAGSEPSVMHRQPLISRVRTDPNRLPSPPGNLPVTKPSGGP